MKKFFITTTCLLSALFVFTNTVTAYPIINTLGGEKGFGENYLQAGDDNSTSFIDLKSIFPSGINFYGKYYTGLYINNNGYVSFNAPSSSWYTSSMANVNGINIIAPFYSDVDTRAGSLTPSQNGNSTGSNRVWWDIDTTTKTFSATWDDVGQYVYGNIPNAFQLSISNSYNDANYYEVTFRYEDINWDYNNSARAGFSNGDGTNFYEIPVSENAQMLNIDTLVGNNSTNQAGLWEFKMNSGSPLPVPEPSSLILSILSLSGLVKIAKKRKTV